MENPINVQKEQHLDYHCCIWCRINHIGRNPCPIRDIQQALEPYLDKDETIKYVYDVLFDFKQDLPCVLYRFNKEALVMEEQANGHKST